MRLREFFTEMAPLLVGRTTPAEAVRSLYAETDRAGRDASRLWIYARSYRMNSMTMLENRYPLCRKVVLKRAGVKVWPQLVMRYYAEHPQRHFRYARCSDAFPDFARKIAAEMELPPWLPDLADLELWSALAREAPNHPDDREPDAGPLRLASTLELRDHAYDLVEWLRQDAELRPRAPAPRRTIVAVWRDRDLNVRQEVVGRLELLVLQAAHRGMTTEPSAAREIGATAEDLAWTLDQLHHAGVILGAR